MTAKKLQSLKNLQLSEKLLYQWMNSTWDSWASFPKSQPIVKQLFLKILHLHVFQTEEIYDSANPPLSTSEQTVLLFFFRYDYIAVYDLLDNQVGQRYCGSIMSPVYKEVKGNVAVVVFHSDSTNSKKGFVLSYEAHTCLTSAKVEE